MKFQVLNPLAFPNWDDRLKFNPQATIFHSRAWAAVLCQSYGYTPAYFTLAREDRLDVLFPLMEVNSLLTGKRGICLPFTDECQPLLTSGTSFEELFAQAIDYAQDLRWQYVEWRGGGNRLANAAASLVFYHHCLDLRAGEKALFEQLGGSTRRAIRKAEQSGLEIEMTSSIDALRAFYDLHCRTRKKHGLPPQPFLFFLQIHQQIISKGLGMVVQASYRSQPIAAAVFFYFGKQAVYKFGASSYAFQHLRANDLVMWNAIKYFADNGFEQMSFGRTSLANAGLRRFKLGWGSREETIEYYKYDLKTAAFAVETDRATGWHNAFFRRLPIRLSRLAGKLLYRHIA